VNTRAIALGTLTDILCTKIFLFALVLVLIDPGSSSQAPLERINPELLEAMCLLWGLFFTGVGGFVAGRLAPQAPVLHGLLVGAASMAVSHLFYGWTPAEVGPALYSFGVVMSLSLALLGGRLARYTARKA